MLYSIDGLCFPVGQLNKLTSKTKYFWMAQKIHIKQINVLKLNSETKKKHTRQQSEWDLMSIDEGEKYTPTTETKKKCLQHNNSKHHCWRWSKVKMQLNLYYHNEVCNFFVPSNASSIPYNKRKKALNNKLKGILFYRFGNEQNFILQCFLFQSKV